MIHGLMLLAGTVAVSFGFIAGLMYLVQSWRLKHKLPPQAGFKLPSLEWLQTINKQSLAFSSIFIAAGLLAGIVLNATKAGGPGAGVPWTDSVVIGSSVLLVWLVAATVFEWLYKPAQQGRKVAYLTVASFVFLAMVMALLVVSSEHASPNKEPRTEEPRTKTAHPPWFLASWFLKFPAGEASWFLELPSAEEGPR
jgi:hypothetical protein